MKVLIYGAGMLGRQVYNLLESYFTKELQVVGFIDDVRQPGESVVHDLPVLGNLHSVATLDGVGPGAASIIPAIGYSNMKARADALHGARKLGYSFANLVHPAAFVEKNVSLGQGIILLPGVVIDQNVKIADFNYLDIGTNIGEDTTLGENNYLSSGTTIGGSVTIGADNFFGMNTTVVNDISLGDNNFLNAASLVHRNLGSNQQVIELREQRLMTRQ